jgi:DNA-binding response OmpR family regulator
MIKPNSEFETLTINPEPTVPSALPAILVVDDEAPIRDLILKVLQRAGYRVLLASDGQAAKQHIEQSEIGLVISDLYMPQMDGLELVMHLRDQSRAIPVIAMSGAMFGRDEDVLRTARLLGAALTLPKPFIIEELLAAVNQFVSAPTRKSPRENGS